MEEKKKRKRKKGAGRPTVMTPETIRKLEYAFSIGCSDGEACYYADISHQSLYEYQKKNPAFTERKNRLKERPVLLARESVIRALPEDSDLSLKFLERKRKKEFSLRTENETSHTVTNLADAIKQLNADEGGHSEDVPEEQG